MFQNTVVFNCNKTFVATKFPSHHLIAVSMSEEKNAGKIRICISRNLSMKHKKKIFC